MSEWLQSSYNVRMDRERTVAYIVSKMSEWLQSSYNSWVDRERSVYCLANVWMTAIFIQCWSWQWKNFEQFIVSRMSLSIWIKFSMPSRSAGSFKLLLHLFWSISTEGENLSEAFLLSLLLLLLFKWKIPWALACIQTLINWFLLT